MKSEKLVFNKKDHLGYINLPPAGDGNKIDLSISRDLMEVCHQINGDEDTYVTVITGTGPQFWGKSETSCDSTPGNSPVEALASLNCPVIGVIQGDALGEGLELALACDIRIASDQTRFGLPQISEGTIPVNGGTQRLSRVVGKGKALEMVLTGLIIDAPEAYGIGLVHKITSPDKLNSEAENLAKSLAAKAPFALKHCKEAINKGLDLTLEQGLRLEADLYFLLHTTSDRTEGIKSFLAKRPPQYEGR